MHFLIFLFEISDKMIPVGKMYLLFILIGLIGLLLGLWRWWISIIWFLAPSLLLALTYLIDLQELNEDLVLESGNHHIWHSFIAIPGGLGLSLLGILLGLRKRKINLK